MTAAPPGESPSGPRTLVLHGSPRPSGRTAALTRLFLDSLPGVHETLSVCSLAPSPCSACGGCAGTGECVVGDGMSRVREGMARADCLVIASPLHFTSLTAPLVALISRWQSDWELRRAGAWPRAGSPRLGVVIATGGSDYPGMFECARRVALAGFATIGAELAGVLSVPGTDSAGRGFSDGTRAAAGALARNVLSRWESKKSPPSPAGVQS